jgi:hypothetical protein
LAEKNQKNFGFELGPDLNYEWTKHFGKNKNFQFWAKNDPKFSQKGPKKGQI